MYFIYRHDNNCDARVINHHQLIGMALNLLESSVRDYVTKLCGEDAGNNMRVVPIKDQTQISEPMTDGITVYQISDDQHKLFVYQRKTNVIPGLIYGASVVSSFKKVSTFYIHHYDNIIVSTSQPKPIPPPIEYVKVNNISMPKPMTISPIRNVIDELKNSKKFLNMQMLFSSI